MILAVAMLIVSVVFFVALVLYLYRGPGSSGYYRRGGYR